MGQGMKIIRLLPVLILAAAPAVAQETAVPTVAETATANDDQAKMRRFYAETIADWIVDPMFVDAIKTQNADTASYNEAQITAMDMIWQGEAPMLSGPIIDTVLHNDSAEKLRAIRDASEGKVSEIFFVDALGMNVAASDITSDYWQGDEAKYQQTFLLGAGTVHLGDVEFDESTQVYQAQISVTISDPATNEPIGAMTVGVVVDKL